MQRLWDWVEEECVRETFDIHEGAYSSKELGKTRT
jgi:hypothetical protein